MRWSSRATTIVVQGQASNAYRTRETRVRVPSR
jgi:hypothetical protein